MNHIFRGPIATELLGFLRFKRDLGYGYRRAEFTLRDFDRFLIEYVTKDRYWQLDQAAISWLSSRLGRKAVSVSDDAGVLRQFFHYLRRSSASVTVVEPIWPRLPTQSQFVHYFISKQDILNLLVLCADLNPHFRAVLYRSSFWSCTMSTWSSHSRGNSLRSHLSATGSPVDALTIHGPEEQTQSA